MKSLCFAFGWLALLALGLASPAAAQDRNRALELNAASLTNDYVSLSDKFDLWGPSSLTIEAWVHPTSYAGFPTIAGNDYQASWWFGLNTTGNPRFYPRGGSAFDATVTVPLNAWTHLAATYDGATTKIFMNGVEVASSAAFSGPIGVSLGDLRIGADRLGASPSYFWRGYLDEVRLWNVARTGAQIGQTMYAGGASVSQPSTPYVGLRSYWDFEILDPPNARDAYTSGRSGALMGTASYTFAPAAPISYNIALELNGTSDWWEGFPISGFGNGITLMAWIAPASDVGNNRAIVAQGFQTSFYLGLNPSGRLRFYPAGSFAGYVESGAVIPAGRWTHVAATYSDGLACFYVNGRLDKTWRTISGPVAENTENVSIGADRFGTTPAYFFPGFIDEVKIIKGELGRVEILREMTQGGLNGTHAYVDYRGRVALGRDYPLDVHTDGLLRGSDGRFVRSGAPMWDPESPLYGAVPFETFGLGGMSLPQSLPEGGPWTDVTSSAVTNQPGTVSDVDCFVVMSCGDNRRLRIQLRSPAGTTVSLMDTGAGRGRDLATMFDDEAATDLATGEPPYVVALRPSHPLAAFDGELAAGTWTMDAQMAPPLTSDTFGLWAWGARINQQVSLGSEAPGPRDLTLRNTGANPVRAQGSLSFTLPREARVSLGLFDAQGRRVRELLSGSRPAGLYQMGWNAGDLRAGVYFLRMRAGDLGEKSLRVSVVR